MQPTATKPTSNATLDGKPENTFKSSPHSALGHHSKHIWQCRKGRFPKHKISAHSFEQQGPSA
jgi:hypothetical protein